MDTELISGQQHLAWEIAHRGGDGAGDHAQPLPAVGPQPSELPPLRLLEREPLGANDQRDLIGSADARLLP
ncbi:hypothetical protein [Saccharopolyspora spinosa]|uniref:hypothetical protein n=1 Tax=Saccharopolyspora spinosa TaxID=60894 RepID=UPI003BABC785